MMTRSFTSPLSAIGCRQSSSFPKVGASAVARAAIFTAALLACGVVLADAKSVMNYSEEKLLSVGAAMGEAVSSNSPRRVDSTTILLGAIFVRQTKTFIYKYDSSQTLDLAMGKTLVNRQFCGDPMRKAFMYRGFVFRHSYTTPSGQQNLDVRYSDC